MHSGTVIGHHLHTWQVKALHGRLLTWKSILLYVGGTAQQVGGPFDKEGSIGHKFTTEGSIGECVCEQHIHGGTHFNNITVHMVVHSDVGSGPLSCFTIFGIVMIL